MKLSQWINKNRGSVAFALSAAAPISIGAYINVFTGIATANPAPTLLQAFQGCGWWNSLIGAFLILIYWQYRVGRLPEDAFASLRSRLIRRLLEAACRSIVYPRSLDGTHIRAIVSLIATDRSRRIAKFSFNADPDPERQGEWPVDFGVTGEAITGKMVVLKELPENHHEGYPLEIQGTVLAKIRTILAAPIMNPKDRRGSPIGVVAFDSELTITELGFDHREIRQVCQSWADLLAMIITQHDISEEVE